MEQSFGKGFEANISPTKTVSFWLIWLVSQMPYSHPKLTTVYLENKKNKKKTELPSGGKKLSGCFSDLREDFVFTN